MKSHSLKYLRIAAALLCIAAVTVLFADFSGTVALRLSGLAKIQFVPALLAVNALALIFLVVLTLVFGRLYCSVLCPLGILQDIVAWFRRVFAPKRKRRLGLHHYQAPHKAWRYSMLGIFALLFVAGLYRLFREDNQYLFMQFCNGYGESMIAYNQFRRYLRFGFVIKPRSVTIF